jgi:hypothetical protein
MLVVLEGALGGAAGAGRLPDSPASVPEISALGVHLDVGPESPVPPPRRFPHPLDGTLDCVLASWRAPAGENDGMIDKPRFSAQNYNDQSERSGCRPLNSRRNHRFPPRPRSSTMPSTACCVPVETTLPSVRIPNRAASSTVVPPFKTLRPAVSSIVDSQRSNQADPACRSDCA